MGRPNLAPIDSPDSIPNKAYVDTMNEVTVAATAPGTPTELWVDTSAAKEDDLALAIRILEERVANLERRLL